MAENRYKNKAKHKNKSTIRNQHINLGLLVFGVLAIYIVIIIIYNTAGSGIDYSIAEPGNIVEKGTFEGVILRDETVITSTEAGDLNFYVPEGKKVQIDSYICSVNEDMKERNNILESIMNEQNKLADTTKQTSGNYRVIVDKLRDYTMTKYKYDFEYTYTAKNIMETAIFDRSQTKVVDDYSSYRQIQDNIKLYESDLRRNGSFYKTPVSGVISYTFDGFEEYNLTNYSPAILRKEVVVNDLTSKKEIEENTPIFKIIDNYTYYIYTEVDSIFEYYAKEGQYVEAFFPSKNTTIAIKVKKLSFDNGKIYALFELDRYFDLFFTDRDITFNIIYKEYNGIKIQNSAITSKELYKVPISAIQSVKGKNAVQKQTENNEIKLVYVYVYYYKDNFAYINELEKKGDIRQGDAILTVNDDTAKISDTAFYSLTYPEEVEGVYVVNKGFAAFKRIETLYKEDAFCIIENKPGLNKVRIYDKIASDGNRTQEFDTFQ